MTATMTAAPRQERQSQTTIQDAPGGKLLIDAPLLCDGCHRVIGWRAARPWTQRCRVCKRDTSREAETPALVRAA